MWGYPHARPLLEAVTREIGRRGAYPLLRLTFGGGLVYHRDWLRHAPLDLLGEPAPIDVHTLDHCDALLAIAAPDNTRDGSDIAPERMSAVQGAYRRSTERVNASDFPWVMCWYPTPALAQDAGMPLSAFEDFLYDAVLLDWDAEEARMRRIAELFDAAGDVRIEAAGTDLTMSLAGRTGSVDDGHVNMPGGEVFYSPLEDSANGVIEFGEFPAVLYGTEVEGVRLVFEDGRVVDASARVNEGFLLQTLDTDEGARRLGELGIGCNPGIQRFMKNVGFDEKINGTIHLALGRSYTFIGGKNESSIHWDIVKDLRTGGHLYVDGRLVQEAGRWLDV